MDEQHVTLEELSRRMDRLEDDLRRELEQAHEEIARLESRVDELETALELALSQRPD
jgi:hypothetical protein